MTKKEILNYLSNHKKEFQSVYEIEKIGKRYFISLLF